MKRFIQKGDTVHVYNRGNRKMPIFNEQGDKWRFLQCLRYFNHQNPIHNIFQQLSLLRRDKECGHFEWPSRFPVQQPLVKIIDYCLMPNHFHLCLQEIKKDGISRFMQRLGVSFTKYMNKKYEQSGRLFQGPYQSRRIIDDKQYSYLDAYIQVFNPFELHQEGFSQAVKNFDKAFEFVINYPFVSLGENFGRRNLGIIDKSAGLSREFSSIEEYKEFAREAINHHRNVYEELGDLTIE